MRTGQDAVDGALVFSNRAAFRAWLAERGRSSEGVWLLFGKAGGPPTLTASEALEEALCFGWIDGQMRSVDNTRYVKYFARRTANSRWSDKNKALVQDLEARGLMTGEGRAAVDAAKRNGQWDAPRAPDITDEQIAALEDLLAPHEPAGANFRAMPPSVRRTYARGYYDAKTDAGRASRLAWMIDRLNRNLKPM